MKRSACAELSMRTSFRKHHLKPFALCGWLFLFFCIAEGQTKISSVELTGNSYFSQRELTEKIPSKSGALLLSIDQSKSVLQELYHSAGFYAFTIDSVTIIFADDSLTASVKFFLNEHQRTLISAIILSGNNVFTSQELLSSFESSSGNALDPAVLESDIQTILDRYGEHGYPFASVNSDSVRTDLNDGSQLIVQLNISEGARVTLDEVRIEGNTTTSSSVIAREVNLVSGAQYDQRSIPKIRQRLERLQLFSSVNEPQLYIISDGAKDSLRGGLLISVKEGNSNTFDGIVGYVPSNDPNIAGYFTGNVFVALRNLFGTGRKALIRWQRETQSTQELELQYREPWLFGIPLNIGGTFFQRKQDSSYVKTRIELRGDFLLSEDLSVSGNILSESVYPSADIQQFTVFESSTLFLGGEILYDTRDNIRNTTSGVRYATSFQQGRKNITGPEQYLSLAPQKNFSIQKYSIDAESFIRTFNRQVIMLGIHGKQITSSQLELSDLFQFGGTTTLRGYRENQFFASQIAYINAEYRFLTGRASSFFGFFDAGYFSRPADAVKGILHQEKSLYGYGLGARIETGLGIMNISYALGKGDSFSNGKIHVGIINEF
ncbi:MAG: BamA/OMP85 family outer membrane protein [Bacteroidota bacterium]